MDDGRGMDGGMRDGEVDGSGGQGSAWWGIQDRGRDLQAEGAATRRARQVAPGRGGKAHPKTGLNGARASQAKGDGLEDHP
jgi:hypothetical protein